MYKNRFFESRSISLGRNGCIALLLCGLPALASAAVPHTFVDGTPALAAEVNENFSSLDGRITSLESLNLPNVNVDCGVDPDALQTAIDVAPPGGQNIWVSGTCNDVSIISKQNLSIADDPNDLVTSRIMHIDVEEPDTVNIGISSGIFIENIEVDANGVGESAVRVGGSSTVVFTNLIAFDAVGANLSVASSGVVFLDGSTMLGDGDDAWAVEMDERATIIAEGDVTLNGTAVALDMADYSFFDQDSQGNVGDELVIGGGGKVLIGAASRLEIENGSITATDPNDPAGAALVLSGASVLARPGAGQSVVISSTTGKVELTRSVLDLDTSGGGTATVSGAQLTSQFGSLGSFRGAGTSLDPNDVMIQHSSQVVVSFGASAAGTNFELSPFASLLGNSSIDGQVTCNIYSWAFKLLGGNLCSP